MAFDYINEAFKRLDAIDEALFDTSLNGINELNKFIDAGDDEQTVRVIDPDAVTEEDLQDSYIGKVILNCNICHSHIFSDKENIVIDDEGLVNKEECCPYCGECEGFVIVGEIAPYATADATVDNADMNLADEAAEESDAAPVDSDNLPLDESMSAREKLKRAYPELNFRTTDDANFDVSRATRRATELTEDFKEVTITTDEQHMEMTSDENGKVTVTTEPVNVEVTEETTEVIAPIDPETEAEIIENNEESDETSVEEPAVEEAEFEEAEFDFDEADEEGFDELGESYFKNVYENVESFKTTNIMANNSHLIVEGVITFASGNQKTTGFLFEAKDVNSRGQLRFSGANKHLCESAGAFSLVGRIDNKKLFVESLKYNYTVADNAVRGVVRRK